MNIRLQNSNARLSPKPLPRPSRAFAAYMAMDKDFQGIGPALAARLEERFGEHLRDVIAAQDPQVAEIIGEKNAQAAFIAYKVKAHEVDVVGWLQDHAIDEKVGVRTAIKIARCWGGEAVNALRDNPFVLLAFLPWNVVDRIAQRLGVQPGDQRRRAAAIEAVLYAHLDGNDTAVPVKKIIRAASELVGLQDSHAWEDTIERALASGGAARLGEDLQPYGAAVMETEIARWVLEAAMKSPFSDLALPNDSGDDLENRIATFERNSPHSLTNKQRLAIRLGLTSRIMILAGYAGTGKTTSLRGICEISHAQGRQLHLMALSGRAAQRMSQSAGFPAGTIAGFLASIRDGRRTIAPGDIVVIDEASMVDLPLLWRILRVIGDASLMLVGDPAQLPPIGFGLTFHAFCNDNAVPRTDLDEVLRQTAQSGIPKIAESVRNGQVVKLPDFAGLDEGVTFTPCCADHAVARLQSIYARLLADGADNDDVQVIAPVRRGPAGIEAINSKFHAAKHQISAAEYFPGRKDVAGGDPIIWTQNDWDRELMNGSLGRIESVYDGVAHASLDGKVHDLTSQDADFIELAHAISVHKAQGSQWPVVIVPVFQSKILDRSLIYTAITRATKQVILIGDPAALHRSVQAAPSASRRSVGLNRRLLSAKTSSPK